MTERTAPMVLWVGLGAGTGALVGAIVGLVAGRGTLGAAAGALAGAGWAAYRPPPYLLPPGAVAPPGVAPSVSRIEQGADVPAAETLDSLRGRADRFRAPTPADPTCTTCGR